MVSAPVPVAAPAAAATVRIDTPAAEGAIPFVLGVASADDLLPADHPTLRQTLALRFAVLEDWTPGMRRVLLGRFANEGERFVAALATSRQWEVQPVAPPDAPGAPEQAAYLARHAHAVLALWDGQLPMKADSGAAYIAHICRTGVPSVEGEILAAPQTTPLLHVLIGASASAAAAKGVSPDEEELVATCKEFRAFGRYAARLRERRPQRIATSAERLVPTAEQSSLDAGTRALLTLFATADAMALERQVQRRGMVRAASIATVAGAFAQASYVVSASPPLLVAYGAAAALAYGLYLLWFRLPMFRIEERYLDYRSLAEALRVQLFWHAAGIRGHVAEHYLQLVRGDEGWVREALRGWLVQAGEAGREVQGQALVKRAWIDSQARYFLGDGTQAASGKAGACRRLQRRFELASNIALGMGAALVVTAIAANYMPVLATLKSSAFSYSASLFVLAGVIRGYLSAMGYAEQASSYEKTGAVFRNAQRVWEAQPARRAECLLALGKYALAENADWLMQRRQNAYRVRK